MSFSFFMHVGFADILRQTLVFLICYSKCFSCCTTIYHCHKIVLGTRRRVLSKYSNRCPDLVWDCLCCYVFARNLWLTAHLETIPERKIENHGVNQTPRGMCELILFDHLILVQKGPEYENMVKSKKRY